MAMQYPLGMNLIDPALDRRGHHISAHYEAFGIIAKGAFGSVILAHKKNVRPVEYVAIKKTSRRTDQEEEDVLWSVRHQPFLLKYMEKYGNCNYFYTVTEYCPGGNLHQVMNAHGAFQEDVMRFYACELVMAVAILHQKGILHLDIKPGNILFDKRGHIVLVDFGMSMRTKNRSNRCVIPCSLAGTRGYQSPEYLTRREVHESTDWWAVGVVCYEMLEFQKPFANGIKDPEKIQKSVLSDELRIPDSISSYAGSFLAALLAKESLFRLGFSNTHSVLTHRFFDVGFLLHVMRSAFGYILLGVSHIAYIVTLSEDVLSTSGINWKQVRSKNRKSPIISKMSLPDLPKACTHHPDSPDLPELRHKYHIKTLWTVDKTLNPLSSLNLQPPAQVDADLLETTDDDDDDEENTLSQALQTMFRL